MEENFEDDVFIAQSNGNKTLGRICEDIFYTNGRIGYYSLSKRVSEPSQEFENNIDCKPLDEDFSQ